MLLIFDKKPNDSFSPFASPPSCFLIFSQVIPGIQPIIDAQVQLRDKIVGLVGSVTSPVTDKLRDTLFSPLLGMVLGPMGNAFKVRGNSRLPREGW